MQPVEKLSGRALFTGGWRQLTDGDGQICLRGQALHLFLPQAVAHSAAKYF